MELGWEPPLIGLLLRMLIIMLIPLVSEVVKRIKVARIILIVSVLCELYN